jgi:outer membrane protein assembly factor BamB
MADGAVVLEDLLGEDLLGLMAVDADTGQRGWTLRDGSGVASSPMADTGVVYFADTAGRLTAVDAATGDAVELTGRPVRDPHLTVYQAGA